LQIDCLSFQPSATPKRIIYEYSVSFDSFPKIQDYGVIGDCRSAALISREGSLDWLCWPRFDSNSIFASLLDRRNGGRWSIAPAQPFETERNYVSDTNVLQTRFICSSGEAILTDLMPVASEKFKSRNLVPDQELVRQVLCTQGEVEIEVWFHPRANYGAEPVKIRDRGRFGLRMYAGKGIYSLQCDRPIQVGDGEAHATYYLKRGDELQFSLTHSDEEPIVILPLGGSIHGEIQRTIRWWQQWAARCAYHGPYRDAVVRSALALKLLAYSPSGALAAATTTSLPEIIGGSLNWDYRYCWLRDAALMLRALMGIGYQEEAESFLLWLLHTTALSYPRLQVLYTLFGEKPPRERELPHLSGYKNSRPVRLGNGAKDQVQLDVYGEVIDAAAHYARGGARFDKASQQVLLGFGKYVAQNWDKPDEGIWEPRYGKANHTHSRLLCWVALDRLVAMGDKEILSGVPREWFMQVRARIRHQIETRAWNAKLATYVSTLDGNELDASALLMSWYGFECPDSERMMSTYSCIMEKLSPADHLIYRYQRDPKEGAFGICGFWAVEHLAMGGGSLKKADQAFQRLLQYRNDLGLYSEETDPGSGDSLGNFPQAFTHIGLISAALSLQEREQGARHPSEETGKDTRQSSTRGLRV
jgi:GH15 family glucan-1,4-alpha-glucosidase